MRSLLSRKSIHDRIHARQNVPVGPAAVPRQDPAYSIYVPDPTMPTATALVFDTTAHQTFYPTTVPQVIRTTSSSSTPLSQTTSDTSAIVFTDSAASVTTTALTADTTALDLAQQVYDEMANIALHSLPPAVIGIASGGSALIVILALYCYICRWYYRRLPRSTKRWDVDDRAKKEVIYGDNPRYSPEDNQPPRLPEDGRRGVPVGDSYFPQGETWQKFEGRTAHHPESFIYTGSGLPPGMGPHSPDSPGASRSVSNPSLDLPRPWPRFVDNQRRGQVESVFSDVSFPTTHRAESMRYSFFLDGYEHDGEVWDLASPGYANEAARPSLDSTARSVNRASIFGEASARARGSVVIYDSQPCLPVIAKDPFAGPGERGGAVLSSPERFYGKKSFEGHGKKSFDGYHARTRSHDPRALDTLAEDVDESASQAYGTMTSSKPRFHPRV